MLSSTGSKRVHTRKPTVQAGTEEGMLKTETNMYMRTRRHADDLRITEAGRNINTHTNKTDTDYRCPELFACMGNL